MSLSVNGFEDFKGFVIFRMVRDFQEKVVRLFFLNYTWLHREYLYSLFEILFQNE